MARPNESLDELFAHWRAEPVLPAPAQASEARAGTAAVARALRDVAERRRRQQKLRKLGVGLSVAAGVFGIALAGWVGYGEVSLASEANLDLRYASPRMRAGHSGTRSPRHRVHNRAH